MSRDGQGRDFGRDTFHTSVFAWTEYAVTPEIYITAEGRYTEEDIDYAVNFEPPFDFFFGLLPGATPGNPILISFGRTSGNDFAEIKESYFTPRFSLSYRPSDDLNLYASVAKGVKPSGNSTGGILRFGETTSYDQETLWAYEVGAKTRLADGQLALDGAFFYQDYKDQQVASQIFNQETQLLQGVIENAGKSTIWGIEVAGNWLVNDNFSLNGAYTFIDAQFDEFRVVSTSANRIGEAGCGELLTFDGAIPPACLLIYDGNRPTDLPKHQLTLTGTYTDQLTENWNWFAEANVRYSSRRELESANIAWQEAYWMTDVRWGINNDNYRIALFADNLFDDDTVTDANTYLDFFNNFSPAPFAKLPQPLTVGLRVNLTM